MRTLLDEIGKREERRPALLRDLARKKSCCVQSTAEVTTDLRSRLEDSRELLNGSIAEARQMLRLLIVDRLQLRPGAKGYEFSGAGTVEPILEGNVPANFHFGWRPHRVPLGSVRFDQSPTVEISGVITPSSGASSGETVAIS